MARKTHIFTSLFGGLKQLVKAFSLHDSHRVFPLILANLSGHAHTLGEEFEAELDYLVEYYEGKYTAEYIRENMGDAAIKDNALFAKVQDFILERTDITYH